MAAATHITTPPAFANAVSVATPGLQPETVTMLAALLDPPGVRRCGRIVGLVIRHVPRFDRADLSLSPVIA